MINILIDIRPVSLLNLHIYLHSSYLTDRPDFRSVLNIQNSNMGATEEMWALHLRCVTPPFLMLLCWLVSL